MKSSWFWAVCIGITLFNGNVVLAKREIGRDLALRGVGLRIGMVKPEDVNTTIGFGAYADLGDLLPRLRLYPGIDYWSQSADDDWGYYHFESSISELNLAGDLRYYFPVESDFHPYTGGGMALLYTKTTAKMTVNHSFPNAIPSSSNSDSEFDLGVAVFIGLEFDLDGGKMAFLETKMKFDGINTFKLSGGVAFPIGSDK